MCVFWRCVCVCVRRHRFLFIRDIFWGWEQAVCYFNYTLSGRISPPELKLLLVFFCVFFFVLQLHIKISAKGWENNVDSLSEITVQSSVRTKMFSCFTESCRLDEGLHSPRFYSLALKESCTRPPARVSSLVFKCLRWKIGHGSRQPRRAAVLTVTFVLGKVTTMCQVSILLTAVEGTGGGDRCWHKLDWWHVRLVFRSLKRTGPNSFDCVCVCVREWLCVRRLLVIQDGRRPACVFLW